MAKHRTIRRAIPRMALALTLTLTSCSPAATTVRLSIRPDGSEANGPSFDPVMTADGRSVIFGSQATNLEGLGDPQVDDTEDVFVKDRTGGGLQLLSVAASGGEGNGDSFFPATSADGKLVAFTSTATNLTTRDANGPTTDVYLRDRTAGTTALVSRSTSGLQGNGRSTHADVSANGRFVAFTSQSDNLVPVDTNTAQDVFVRDLQLGTTTRASMSSGGGQLVGDSDRPAISDAGVVAFITRARVSPADTDADADVYVRDAQQGVTSLVSLNGASTVAAGFDISADGRYVAFTSTSGSSVAQAWIRDRVTGQVRLLSDHPVTGFGGNGSSGQIAISDDGRSVAFSSSASDLVAGDTNASADIFLTDRDGGAITRVSVDGSGGQADDFSTSPTPANGGRVVAFRSAASNLVREDDNLATDIFVRTTG